MTIRVFDIALRTGSGVTVKQFLDSLHEDGGISHEWRKFNRELYLQPYDDDFYCGVFITRYPNRYQMVVEGNKLHASALSGRQKSASVNFLLVHQKTGRGVYTHYQGSTAYSAFNAYIKFRYEPLRADLEEDAKVVHQSAFKAAGKKVTLKSLRAIGKEYRGTAEVSRVVRKDALGVLIDELAEVELFEFPIDDVFSKRKAYRPLASIAKSKKAIFRLEPSVSKKEKKKIILNAVEEACLNRGTIKGKNANGDPRSFHLEEARNKSLLNSWDFDTIMKGIEIDFSDLKSCDIFDQMRGLAKPITRYRQLLA
jgi:hypothetical protein